MSGEGGTEEETHGQPARNDEFRAGNNSLCLRIRRAERDNKGASIKRFSSQSGHAYWKCENTVVKRKHLERESEFVLKMRSD